MSDRRRAMMAIGASPGGRARTESGTFTVASGYLTSKAITHGLNTTRLFGMIWMEPDENDQIIAPQGYNLIFGHFITVDFAKALYEGVEIVENYTSNATKTAVYPVDTVPRLRRYKSTWTSAAAGWDNTSNGAFVRNLWVIANSNSEFEIKTESTNTYMGVGTYHWQVWALDDWTGG